MWNSISNDFVAAIGTFFDDNVWVLFHFFLADRHGTSRHCSSTIEGWRFNWILWRCPGVFVAVEIIHEYTLFAVDVKEAPMVSAVHKQAKLSVSMFGQTTRAGTVLAPATVRRFVRWMIAHFPFSEWCIQPPRFDLNIPFRTKWKTFFISFCLMLIHFLMSLKRMVSMNNWKFHCRQSIRPHATRARIPWL